MPEALEARELLRKHKNPYLKDVTTGIYHAGRERRSYVSDPKYGVPFLGSTDILLSDLSFLPYLSRKQVSHNPDFLIREGMSLITRSGTVGKMAYTRKDMNCLACSEHVMRVVPNNEEINSGYLYAYLSSRFGIPSIVSGTYGAIIRYIKPEHIMNLPVPRLGKIEDEAHILVQKAADLRTAGVSEFHEAKKIIDDMLQVKDEDKILSGSSCRLIKSSYLLKRIDASYYSPVATRIEKNIYNGKWNHTTIGKLANIMLPPIGSRPMTNEQEHSYSYYSGEALYNWTPYPKGRLAEKSPMVETLLINEEGILVQAFGQTYGPICKPTWVDKTLIGSAISGLMFRLTSPDKKMLRYLYAFIASRAGQIITKRLPYGGSIPHINESQYQNIPVPLFDDTLVNIIDEKIKKFVTSKIESNKFENEAHALVEHAIEEGGQ
jgi:type I restriction enzyme S subunit